MSVAYSSVFSKLYAFRMHPICTLPSTILESVAAKYSSSPGYVGRAFMRVRLWLDGAGNVPPHATTEFVLSAMSSC